MQFIYSTVSFLAAACIRAWVRLSGKRVARHTAPWLECPMGTGGRIGAEFYTRLAEKEGLGITRDSDTGLLPDFDALRGTGFDPESVDPRIRDFYEHTARYRLEAWSEAPVHTRLFLWLLTKFVSRPMDQLNFPVSSLELAGGMTSEILTMRNDAGQRVYTGWLRRLVSSERVVYTGLYSTERPALWPDPCVKVSFPVPQGSATVFLRPEAQTDGSLKLISAGTRFGEAGFYRMQILDSAHWKVRYIKSLKETFHVYVDKHGTLRTDHLVRFLGFTALRLHYKLEADTIRDTAATPAIPFRAG